MTKQRSFLGGTLCFTFILLLGLIINTILGISGFKDVYKSALNSKFNIQGDYLKTRIESAINFGKKLYLLEDEVLPLFYETKNRTPGIAHIFVTDKNDTVLFSTRESNETENTLPFIAPHIKNGTLDTTEVNLFDAVFLCTPVFTNAGEYKGSIFIEYKEKQISTYLFKIGVKIIQFALFLFFLAVILYIFLFFLGHRTITTDTIITIVLLISTQCVFAFSNYRLYNQEISAAFSKNMTVLAKSIAVDLQNPLEYVKAFNNMDKTEEYLKKRLDRNPECSGIYFTNNSLLVSAGISANPYEEIPESISRQNTDFFIQPIISHTSTNYLVLEINRKRISAILLDMALDSATIILVALIFAFVLRDFFELHRRKKDLRVPIEEMSTEESKSALLFIEISTFLFMFASFETLSFIPLLIRDVFIENPGSFIGMAQDTVVSYPVTSYMFGLLSIMILNLFVLKKFSIKTRYSIITPLFILGLSLTAFATSIPALIVARFFAGIGFGGLLINTASLVIANTSNETRSIGFGTNAAVSAAASIAAIPIGGVIVHSFGYRIGIGIAIFFTILGYLVFLIFYVEKSHFLLTKNLLPPVEEAQILAVEYPKNHTETSLTPKKYFKILFSRHILSYIFCVNLPFQFIYVGLFQFVLPLYMSDRMNLSQSNIGRILSVFSIVSLGASYVSKMSDMVKDDKLLLAIGEICAGIALILFNFATAGGLLVFVGVMAAIGIDNVFIDAIEEVYISSRNIDDVSPENLLLAYKMTEKIASVAIPAVTGIIILFFGFSGSMGFIGVYSLIGAALFLLLGKNGRWTKK